MVARGRPAGAAPRSRAPCCWPCASSRPSWSASTTSPPWWCTADRRTAGERRAQRRRQGRRAPDRDPRDQLRRLAVVVLGQLGRLVDRRAPRPRRDLQPHRLAAVRHDRVAAQGTGRAPRAGTGPDRGRLHRDVQRAARPGARHRPRCDSASPTRTGPGSSTTATARAAGPRRGRGHRLDHPVGRLGRHAAARQGRQPQQRAARDRGRVPAHPRADMVPEPEILDRTLGYFERRADGPRPDPQHFVNVARQRPARQPGPLFYGPIQEGKDGWNAAFFCGSNASIRREALMQLGVSRYAAEVEVGVHRALRTARSVVRKARTDLTPDQRRRAPGTGQHPARRSPVRRRELKRGEALFDVTYRFQQRVAATRRDLVGADLRACTRTSPIIAGLDRVRRTPSRAWPPSTRRRSLQLADREWSPPAPWRRCEALVRSIDVDRGGEAQPVMPMATISVTEDMATCMRLHALGWRTAYHDEVLATASRPRTCRPCSPSDCAGRRAPCR